MAPQHWPIYCKPAVYEYRHRYRAPDFPYAAYTSKRHVLREMHPGDIVWLFTPAEGSDGEGASRIPLVFGRLVVAAVVEHRRGSPTFDEFWEDKSVQILADPERSEYFEPIPTLIHGSAFWRQQQKPPIKFAAEDVRWLESCLEGTERRPLARPLYHLRQLGVSQD